MQQFKNYIFDLDATLYQDNGEFEANYEILVDKFFMTRLNMSEAEAQEERNKIISKFISGTEGIRPQFGISVKEFMDYTCAADVSHLSQNLWLEEQLRCLSGRLFIFTDSTVGHVHDTLSRIGVSQDIFAKIFDAEQAGYNFKYQKETFECFFKKCQVVPQESVMFEDSLRNLKMAKSFGITTILISQENVEEDFIDYQFSDINKALGAILE